MTTDEINVGLSYIKQMTKDLLQILKDNNILHSKKLLRVE